MNLDDAALVRVGDPSKVLASIEGFGAQCESGASAALAADLADVVRGPSQIVLAGMGGSALGGDLIRALLAPALRVPFIVQRDYSVPPWVGPRTLVIASSYSGATEETLGAAASALERTGMIVALTTGGPLAEMLEKRGRRVIRIDPAVNPSGQPRFALGAMLFAILGVVEASGVAESFFAAHGGIAALGRAAAALADTANARYGLDRPRESNMAKELAHFFEGRACMAVASRHLAGNAHALANQLNETAKSFAAPFEIPELNHHLMEGLQLPDANRAALGFLFIESSLYGARIEARYAATREVVARQGIPERSFRPHGGEPLLEVLDALIMGSYLAFYLALRNKQDPGKIPWVDHFKARLGALAT